MASKQWLIDPANPDTPMYMTMREEVAQKRADKGDFVLLLERAGDGAKREDFAPYYQRVRSSVPAKADAPPPEDNEDEEL